MTIRLAPALAAAATVAALATAAAGCRGEAREPPPPGAPEPVVLGPEDVVTVERRLIETGPRIAGSLQARERADVRAEVGGPVTDVAAELGQAVRKGQVLARIEDRTLRDAHRSAVAAERSAVEERLVARRQVARLERLVRAGAVAAHDLELARSAAAAAEARAREARARRASARNALEDATVRAPVDGVVSERAVDRGDVVAPGAALYTVLDPSTMRLEAALSAAELAALRVGTPVEFQVRGLADRTFQGRLARIAPAADPVTRQVRVLVEIPNPGGELLAGLFAEGRVVAERREAPVAPLAAVDTSGPTPQVTRVREGVVERVPVTLGVRDEPGGRVELRAGGAPGDTLLAGAARALPAGTPVRLAGDATDLGATDLEAAAPSSAGPDATDAPGAAARP